MKTTLLTSIMLLCVTFCMAEVSVKEKQALIDFYHSTRGSEWTQQWDINSPVAEWPGVSVENNRVTAISLLFNNLQGSLPESIGDLVHLRIIELSFNKLSGSLPAAIGKLVNLEVLAFNGNYLSGTIPSTIGNLTRLKQLHLSSNQLSGEIPTLIGNLSHLEVLNVFDNKLSGDIPPQIAGISSLKELVVAENNFTNTETLSSVLLLNTAKLDLRETGIVPAINSVIAIETEEDGN